MGAFFDHVPPPTAPIPPADALAGDTGGRLGFRTASMVVAPWATPGSVSHEQLDHTSGASSLADLATLATSAGFPIATTTNGALAAQEARFLGTDD